MKSKINFKYIIIGFITGFILSLCGMTFEDYMHNIPFLMALSSLHHFIAPTFIGCFSSLFGFLLWKRKTNQIRAINLHSKNLRALLDINSALISTIEIDSVLQIIIDESTHLTNLETGAIYLHENEKLYLGATTPPLPLEFPEILRYDLLTNHPNIQKSLIEKQPVTIPDTSLAIFSDAEMRVIKFRGLRSIIYIPLIIENRPVGTLILGTINKLRSFSEHEINMYRSFSSQAALTIENARLFKESLQIAEELRQQNEEFLSLNEELSESNLRIQKINDELKLAKEKAEESDRLKSSFLKNMSHEVRTPLNAITGFSSLITNPNLIPEKLIKFSEMISTSSQKLIEIITDVVEISQIHSNLIKTKMSEFDIISILDNLIIRFKNIAKTKNIDLVLNYNILQKEYLIVSDKEKVESIINHLVDNAIKFTAQGSVEINCELDLLNINISISDTGIGISFEMQELIFEPFRQVETGIIRNYGGNGLGLPIAKAYIDILNGSISLKSELNKGSTFMVSIPINKEAIESNKTSVKSKKYSINTILIAEDEYSNYQYLCEILDTSNFKTLYAKNGQQALDLCLSNPTIDLILMDIKMPIMDGNTAAKQIKLFRPDLLIIAQTAYARESEKENFKDAFDDYITKPINADVLKQKLLKYIDK